MNAKTDRVTKRKLKIAETPAILLADVLAHANMRLPDDDIWQDLLLKLITIGYSAGYRDGVDEVVSEIEAFLNE